MISATDVRIIDGEFAGFGPLAQDFGRLTASLTLNYISWFGDETRTAAEKADFQSYLLNTITELYATFQKEFRQLVEAHREESYSLKTLAVDAYLIDQLQNALSYTGVNVMSRLANRGICYDFLRLPEVNRLVPALLGMDIAKELMLNHRKFTRITDYTQLLKNLV
jgi:5-methylthioribose kinase